MNESTNLLPLLPLRDVVVYPHMVIPLFVGREKSVRALEKAMEQTKQILLVAQKNASEDNPKKLDVYAIGTVSNVLQLLRLPDGTIKVLVEGVRRAQITDFADLDSYHAAQAHTLEPAPLSEREAELLTRSLLNQFDQYVKLNKKVPTEIVSSLTSIDDPSRLADTIAAHLSIKLAEKQKILEIVELRPRLEHLISLLEAEIDLLQVEKRLRGRVKKQMEKSQREYYLNEQMKAIQNELGESEDGVNEFDEIAARIAKSGMTKEARKKADGELKKLRMMSPMSAEATVVRNYIDWIINVPWKARAKISADLNRAEKILDDDHYTSKKLKNGSSNTLPSSNVSKRLKDRSCVWSARLGSAKLRLGAQSPAQPIASLCGCRSAACVTRLKSAAIGGLTSARSPVRCSRTCRRSVSGTRCSCSMKSTRWRWIFGATRHQRCSRS